MSGARLLSDNLSDLKAQIAANQRGIDLLLEMVDHYSLDVVQAYMWHIQANAEEAVRHMLTLSQSLDLIIPRGGHALISFVTEHARIPVIKHDRGVCHIVVEGSHYIYFTKHEAVLRVAASAEALSDPTAGESYTCLVQGSDDQIVLDWAGRPVYGWKKGTAVLSQELALSLDVAPKLVAGVVWVNGSNMFDAAAPFGGWKMSGLGREGGAEGIHEYLQTKYTLTPNPF